MISPESVVMRFLTTMAWLGYYNPSMLQTANHLRTIYGRIVSPGSFIKTFYWELWVKSRKCQHQNLQNRDNSCVHFKEMLHHWHSWWLRGHHFMEKYGCQWIEVKTSWILNIWKSFRNTLTNLFYVYLASYMHNSDM